MAEQRSARNLPEPGDRVLEALIEAARRTIAREAVERQERRAKMRLVEGGARRDAA